MKNVPYQLIIMICLIFTFSCNQANSPEVIRENTGDELVFGRFYGFCQGESCIQLYKLNQNNLYEDTNNTYPSNNDFYNGNFVKLGAEDFEKAKSLLNQIPTDLKGEEENVLGCPDCADQGGIYIEIKTSDIHKFWIIDQAQESVPEYLHDYMDQINNVITQLNE